MNDKQTELITASAIAEKLKIKKGAVSARGNLLFRTGKIHNCMHRVVDGYLQRVFTPEQAQLIIDYPEKRGRKKKATP